MNLFRSCLLSLAVAAVSTGSAPAQLTELTGTGCPYTGPGPRLIFRGLPRINTITMTVSMGCATILSDWAFVWFGTVLNPPRNVPTSVTCNNLICTQAVDQQWVLGPMIPPIIEVPIHIPNNPGLVGMEVGAQGACINRQSPCVVLGAGWVIRIMP